MKQNDIPGKDGSAGTAIPRDGARDRSDARPGQTTLCRRQFLAKGLTLAAAAQLLPGLAGRSSATPTSPTGHGMIYRLLGRTGERVSAIGLGGWHIGQPLVSEEDSIQLIRQAVDNGITFMDNCWDYNEGASE